MLSRNTPGIVQESMYTRKLRLAVQAIGSRQSLAAHLGVSEQDMVRWFLGNEVPPQSVFAQIVALVEQRAAV